MLKHVNSSLIPAREAAASLFPQKLEFNPPVHENWNIVHIGMQIPEAHQIYICGYNCMRGVVLTAAEMGAQDRFSSVILYEEDVIDGTLWEATRDGIDDVLRKLPKLPPCVIVFPVCTHHFAGVDMDSIYESLEAEFPSVYFIRAFMDPIMQKHGLPPDQRLRKVMYDPLPICEPTPGTATLLGAEFALEADSDLCRILAQSGYKLKQLQDCVSYEDYLSLSSCEVFLCVHPNGNYGISQTAKRLGRPYLYLPMSFDFDSIHASMQSLISALPLIPLDEAAERAACDLAMKKALHVIGHTPVVIDSLFHPRPLELAKLLSEYGFRVTEVFLDAVPPEEEKAFSWLRENTPDLQLTSIILPDRRVADRNRPEKTLALGPKAAWFTSTEYFVNLVQGGGLWGYAGIRTLAEYMIDAFRQPKDTRDIVPRKGLGCISCI
jgi:hypothetical protein